MKHIQELISQLNAAPKGNCTCELRSRLARAIVCIDPTQGIRYIAMLKDSVLAGHVCLDVISIFSARNLPGLGRIYVEAFEGSVRNSVGIMPCLGHICLAVTTKRQDYLESALRYIGGTGLERRILSLACIFLFQEELEHHQILLLEAKCELSHGIRELRNTSDERKRFFADAMAETVNAFCRNPDEARLAMSCLERLMSDLHASEEREEPPLN